MRTSLAFVVAFLFATLSSGAPQPRGNWENLPSLPEFPRQEHTTVAVGNSIYILAGIIPSGTGSLSTTGLVQRYSIPTRKWHSASPIPVALNHANVAVVAGKIYVLGGLAPDAVGNWTAVTDSFVYDPSRDQWERLASMPTAQARGSAAMGVFGSKVFLAGGMQTLELGGRRLQDTVATVTSYDTVTKSWEELASIEEGRDHAGAAVVDGVFYVLGGRFKGQENVRDTVFALDLSNLKKGWKSLARMPTPRGGIAAGVVNGKVYTFGGEGNPEPGFNGVFNQTEVYDVKHNSWKRLQAMEVPRHGTSAVGVAGTIYIPGGGTVQGGSGLLNIFNAFQP